jgi:hypothetical protein
MADEQDVRVRVIDIEQTIAIFMLILTGSILVPRLVAHVVLLTY